MDFSRQKILNELRNNFCETPSEYMPCSFVDISLPLDAAELKKELIRKKKNGFYMLIPTFSGEEAGKRELLEAHEEFFKLCEGLGVSAFFNLSIRFEEMIIDEMSEYDNSYCAKILTCYKYRCFERENISYNLHNGALMSIVAYDGYQNIIDLREFVSDEKLIWEVPRGNWEILEFVCAADEDSKRIDYLNYRHSLDYISTVCESFGGITALKKPSSLVSLKYNDIGFVGKNRRMWCEDFNGIFEGKYGFDPSPFYPALFFDIGKDTARLKAQFFECRAEILKNGFMKAVYDYCSENDISCVGGIIEPKLTACSQTVGDAMQSNAFAPSALMNRAYLYGINSVKVAAGAAYNFDKETVSCDLYEDYREIDLDIAYKDAMHSLSRGANKLVLHSPKFESENTSSIKKILLGEDSTIAYSKFVAKVQSLMRGGRHISNIALLYPIYTLHSSVYFYDYDTQGFEYPETPQSADYMSVINSVSMYSGHDLTVLHPTVLNEKCHINDGCLYLDNIINKERFSILIIPSTSVISLKNLEIISEFFDRGGKIIATGCLPKHALESTSEKNYDNRVTDLVSHIFGSDASDEGIMRDYCLNTNINGGMAYTLYHSLTAADGTSMTDSASLAKALDNFGVQFDITLSNTKRYESTGALNTIYPIFGKLGLSSHLPNGGMINHIHKKQGDIDIYYISNTTDTPLSTTAKLRGELTVEEWNPHTGKMRKLNCTYPPQRANYESKEFTEVQIEIPAARSIILIASPTSK